MVRGMIRLLSGLENLAHYVDDALAYSEELMGGPLTGNHSERGVQESS